MRFSLKFWFHFGSNVFECYCGFKVEATVADKDHAAFAFSCAK